MPVQFTRFVTGLRHLASSVITQLLVLFAVATVVPLVATVTQIRTDELNAEERAFTQEREIAATAADDVPPIIDDARQTASTLSRVSAFWSGTDEDRDRILGGFAAANPSLFGLVYFTADLQEHGASDPLPAGARRDMSIRPYGREAVATGQLALADQAVPSQLNGTTILPFVLPVHQAVPPYQEGFLSFGLAPDRLLDLWSDVPIASGDAILLVDTRQGGILAGSGAVADHLNQTISPADLGQIREGNATFRTARADGVSVLRAWGPVQGTPWVVIIDTPSDAVLGPIQATATQRAVVDGILGTTGFVLLVLGWKRVSAKLSVLHSAIGYWERAQWEHRAAVSGQDELSRLGHAFDQMAARLEETTAERQAVTRALGEASVRESAAKVRDELFAAASHDLKNPLTSIKVLAQINGRRLGRDDVADRSAVLEDLARIDATATRMVRMIDDLLKAARSDSVDSEVLAHATTNLVAVARHAVLDHQHTTERHQLSFNSTRPQLPVAMDTRHLKRVLDNLLGNATKYSPAGGDIIVTVSAEQHDTRRWVVLRVRDNGVGIPPADLPHIFERYARARNVVGRFEGSGVGLAGVRRMVDMHGGIIEVSSREGFGSTFTLKLPLFD